MATSEEEDDAIETLAQLSLDTSAKFQAPMPGSISGPNGIGVGALAIRNGSEAGAPTTATATATASKNGRDGAESGGMAGSTKNEVGSYNGNGISLVVDVSGANDGGKVFGGAVKDYSKISYGKLLEMFDSSVSQFVIEKGNMIDGKETAEEVGDGVEDNVHEIEIEYDIGEHNDDIEQEHGFSVGDFVWGKIRSHPWWPGQIYDPANASACAVKYKGQGRLLVAYFGDNSFSWSSPSQLKRFVENFEEMSEQSSCKSFINAVQDAVNQFGSLLELEMTCPCVPQGLGISRPQTANAGINAGVLLLQGGIHKLSKSWHLPAELLANVRDIALGLTIDSLLEIRVLKSWLSAFFCAKRGCSLPIYRGPQLIEGLEDESQNKVAGTTNFSVSVEDPIAGALEEDWLSLPVGPGASQFNESMISAEKLHLRRKHKSMAELMKEDTNAEPKAKKGKMMKERTNSSPTSGNKKRKGNHEAEIQDGGVLNTLLSRKKLGTKKTEMSEQSKKPRRKQDTTDEHVDVVCAKGVSESPLSKELNGSNNHIVEDDVGEVKEQAEDTSSSRERKKSGYLSPPYTSPKSSVQNFSSKVDLEIESQTVAHIAWMGERMTDAAEKLIGLPPILRCSAEVLERELPKEISTGNEKSGGLSAETAKPGQKPVNDLMEMNAASKEVLLGVQSAALNPLSCWDKKHLDTVSGFISTYRNSVYMNGSNYSMYHKHQSGRKRKSSVAEYGPQEDLEQTVHMLTKLGSLRTGKKRKKQARSGVPCVEQAGKHEEVSNREAEGNGNLPLALTILFPSGFSIPSKEYLIRKFNEFGVLNQMETTVMYNSNRARIVFVNSCDTERVFDLVVKNNPFGDANVDYQLSYYSATSRGQRASTPSKTLKIPGASQDDESSQLQLIKQKLKKMTSMLKNCDQGVSHEMKSALEGEAKDLLEKVITMASS